MSLLLLFNGPLQIPDAPPDAAIFYDQIVTDILGFGVVPTVQDFATSDVTGLGVAAETADSVDTAPRGGPGVSTRIH